MALSLLVACSRSAQLALVSMKRTSFAILRLTLVIFLPFSVAVLLPDRLLPLLSFLLPDLSALVNPAPIFVLANILIFAIVLSSPSSHSNPHDHLSATSRSRPLFCAHYASHDYYPPPELTLQSLLRQDLPSTVLQQKKQHLLKRHRCPAPEVGCDVGPSERLVSVSLSVSSGGQSDVVCASSQRTVSKSRTQLTQKFGASTQADKQMKQLAIKQRPSKELQLKKHLSDTKEPAQENVDVSGQLKKQLSVREPAQEKADVSGELKKQLSVKEPAQEKVFVSGQLKKQLSIKEPAQEKVAVGGQLKKQLSVKEQGQEKVDVSGQLKKQLSVKEPAQENGVVSGGIVRSNSDSRICAAGTATACEKAIRRTVTAPIESLVDEDFHKRCTEFIANNYQNWKKESLNRRISCPM